MDEKYAADAIAANIAHCHGQNSAMYVMVTKAIEPADTGSEFYRKKRTITVDYGIY